MMWCYGCGTGGHYLDAEGRYEDHEQRGGPKKGQRCDWSGKKEADLVSREI